jgi:extracellular elastinolytic metalloproteinase
VDGRDAILAADLALTGGQNQCAIWRGFAKRGLGYSADQGASTNRGDGTQAFDTHPDCRAGATVTPGAVSGTAPAGGSAGVPIAVGNRAQPDGNDLNWEIRESNGGCSSFGNVSWLSASPASGTTAAAGATDVSVTLDASDLLPGTHTAALCLVSDDEQAPVVEVPVTFTVG